MSSFTQDAERDLFIESTLIPSKFAICSIEASLFSPSFPGTIPTEDISPFPASSTPFLSYISPLSASIVFTLTLSVLLNCGNI